jgi:DNA topoisomerase-1
MKIIRIGTYKTGFTYYNVKGKGKSEEKTEITDSDAIEKLKLLKIPPAYENVTILNNKKIIAYGYDSKNRKQVLYHPAFIAKQNKKKYNKISGSIHFFSKLKRRVAEDLSRGDEKTVAIAVIITLILTCGFRIGNKKYEKDNNSVGLTTLKYKHLQFQESTNTFIIDFIGKKGVRNVAECDNKLIYAYLQQKNREMSQEIDPKDAYIFRYDGGKVITSNDVNEYLRVISAPYSITITTKDLRTWNANMLFLTYYKKLRKQRKQRNIKLRSPEDANDTKEMKENDKDIKNAIEIVAQKLHNSYSICKKSYIDPKIIEGVLHKK